MDVKHESLVDLDPYLGAYSKIIEERKEFFRKKVHSIVNYNNSIENYSNGHAYFGFHIEGDELIYREWAPNAKKLSLIGGFNDWNDNSHNLSQNDKGIWEVKISLNDFPNKNPHQQKIKVRVQGADGSVLDKLPAYIRFTYQNSQNFEYQGVLWFPEQAYVWKNEFVDDGSDLLIYESHVGMSGEKEGVSTYAEFQKSILPRIKDAGYNTVQLMAIMEHPYYGSYGYHVSNLFAPSSRFGTPEELKELIDEAHKLNLRVIMDVVHSHAVKNENEGLNKFDGTDYQYFHSGAKGDHELWDSKVFDYGKEEVQHFLLSNIRYWLEEFHFDGFRFDGITSMLYTHHGCDKAFTNYDMYFNEVDNDALVYLQLANYLIHSINPKAISVAEDMSGMPGLCRPQEEGGIGFDYRLAMGVPDFWIKSIKEKKDEDWDLNEIFYLLTDRRIGEKSIVYSESHDQALVGDKTLAFRLMDKEMYYHMGKGDTNMTVERGLALHKLIRLITLSAGGESYLNFMGNEFGHPEWIDFPREDNGFSYKHARRQWSLRDDKNLSYSYLADFDKAMISLAKSENWLKENPCHLISIDQENLIMIFEKNHSIFVFNFHPTRSIPNYCFGVHQAGTYKILLSSDDESLGGSNRIDTKSSYFTQPIPNHGHEQSLSIYITNRTALVFKKEENV